MGAAAAGRDRGDATQVRERGFGVKPLRVVAGAREQLPGNVDPDALQREQPRAGSCEQQAEVGVGVADLLGQLLVAAGQPAQPPPTSSWPG